MAKKFIDADELQSCIERKRGIVGSNARWTEGYNDAINRIKSMVHSFKAADVQEVVRCKDCKYLKADTLDQKAVYFCTQNVFARRRVELDDYCSCGARMDGDTNA